MTPVSFIYRMIGTTMILNNVMKFFEANEMSPEPEPDIDYGTGTVTKWKYMPVNRWIWELVQAKGLLGYDSGADKFSVTETKTPNVWLAKPLDPENRTRVIVFGDEAALRFDDSTLIAQDIALDDLKRENLGPFDVMPSLWLKTGVDRKKLKQDYPDVTIESLANGAPGWRERADEKLMIPPAEQWKYFPDIKIANMIAPAKNWFSEDKRKRFPKIETLSFRIPGSVK